MEAGDRTPCGNHSSDPSGRSRTFVVGLILLSAAVWALVACGSGGRGRADSRAAADQPVEPVPSVATPEMDPDSVPAEAWTTVSETQPAAVPANVLYLATTGPEPVPSDASQGLCAGAMHSAVGAGAGDVVVVAVHDITGKPGVEDRSASNEALDDVALPDEHGCIPAGATTRATRFRDNGRAVMLSLIAGPEAPAAAIVAGEDLLAAFEVPSPEGPAVPPGDGAWRALAPAPIETRWTPATVWTGTEMLVWGGRARYLTGPLDEAVEGYQGAGGYYPLIAGQQVSDGAAYDPETDSWRTLAPSPLAPEPGWGLLDVWTGSEWLVWSYDVADGMAYEPSSDTWRLLAPRPPVSQGAGGGWVPIAVWTGTEALFWGGFDHCAGADCVGVGLGFDPATDEWRPLAPAPIGHRQFHGGAWTGDELVVWGGTEWRGAANDGQQGAAYDPTTDSWRLLAPVEVVFSDARSGTLWTGSEVVFGGHQPLAYSPAADAWRVIAGSPADVSQTYSVIDGGFLVDHAHPPEIARLDGITGRFSDGQSYVDVCWTPPVWTGSELLIWGGAVCFDENSPNVVGYALLPSS